MQRNFQWGKLSSFYGFDGNNFKASVFCTFFLLQDFYNELLTKILVAMLFYLFN